MSPLLPGLLSLSLSLCVRVCVCVSSPLYVSLTFVFVAFADCHLSSSSSFSLPNMQYIFLFPLVLSLSSAVCICVYVYLMSAAHESISRAVVVVSSLFWGSLSSSQYRAFCSDAFFLSLIHTHITFVVILFSLHKRVCVSGCVCVWMDVDWFGYSSP